MRKVEVEINLHISFYENLSTMAFFYVAVSFKLHIFAHVCLCLCLFLWEWCTCHLPDWHVGPSLPWQWFKDEIQKRETIFLHPSEYRMMCSPLCFGYLTCKSFIVCCLHAISILVSTCLSAANSSTIKSLLPGPKPFTQCCLLAYMNHNSTITIFFLHITMETCFLCVCLLPLCWYFFESDVVVCYT